MTFKDRRPVGLAVALAGCGVLALSGCQQILPVVVQPPPPFDQKTADDLTAAQKDADGLFAMLSGVTGCSYSVNSAQFDLVDKDLAALMAQAASIPNNNFTTHGAGAVQKGFDQFRAAAQAKDPACLPPGIAEDKKASFDGAVANLLTYENNKPKG